MKAILAALAVALMGCKDFMAPMPGNPTLFQPPPQYGRWYALAEDCAGKRGDFDRVRWYWYNWERIPRGRGESGNAVGATWHAQHKIALAQPFLFDSATVIHESIHDIDGRRFHPSDTFGALGADGVWRGGRCSHLI